MKSNERTIIAIILLLVASLVSFDLLTDFKEGVIHWHLATEGLMALAALYGFFIVLKGNFETKNILYQERKNFDALKLEADQWRIESRKYIEGLSTAIDQQLTKWNLTGAEKEVAFLLLKGLSLKEIADIRQTTEKTARTQSMAIYAKAGLSGRSELSAFFLEDLLAPTQEIR